MDINEVFRNGVLDVSEALLVAREKLLALAGLHTETIIPAYTHGVQAQPTTFAHYLLAFAAALERHSERLRQVYTRINRSPPGAAALATSSFPLDRRRLAELLGFEGLVENAYDANADGISAGAQRSQRHVRLPHVRSRTLRAACAGVRAFSENPRWNCRRQGSCAR
jgi:argininosuccinate lyase